MAGVGPIYVGAIPAAERKPTGWIASLPARPDYRLIVAEAGGVVIGFAVVFVPPDPTDAALLEYLAVSTDRRNGGVGGRLVVAALASAGRPVLVEVKSDDAQADRRRAFYARHGCRQLLGLRYLLPMPGAPPMDLLVAAVDRVPRPVLARWLATIYADVYGQSRDDSRLITMLAGLPDPVLMGPSPLPHVP